MHQPDRSRLGTSAAINRRQLLSLGAVVFVSGCVGLFEDEPGFSEEYDDYHEPTGEHERRWGSDQGLDDAENQNEDGDEETPGSAVEFPGFTHFPFDFEDAFSVPVDRPFDELQLPIVHDFYPPAKVGGARKWYTNNPNSPLVWNQETDVYEADWPVYLMADAQIGPRDILVLLDQNYEDVFGATLRDMNPNDLLRSEVHGEIVYQGVALEAQKAKTITVRYSKTQLRKAFVDAVLEADDPTHFPAGTHFGYGLGDFTVYDFRVDTDHYAHPGVNAFDYFIPEKQQRLLELYQPFYERAKAEGFHPFTDLTQSHVYWDEPGTIEGVWTQERGATDVPPQHLPEWDLVAYIGLDKTTADTYWRVLEHPWNVENGFTGLFVNRPDEYFRYYQIDGDRSDGIARIILENRWDAWNPLKPDTDDNHPSIGESHYLRFQVQEKADMWDEKLTLQWFRTEEAARSGLTDEAVRYERGAE